MSTYKTNFTDPYGSIQEQTQVLGTGGFTRHTGIFATDNPYSKQLDVASKNQDIDALYERAVEWEADQANYQQQLEINRQILEEQRQYDLPENEIRRMRDAGINPDLAGSSGSGSGSGSGGASMAVPSIADQQGQTKFSNAYDTTALALQGINTGINFIGTLSTGVSSIMQAVTAMNLAPSQSLLNEANAGLATAQANEVNELLSGRKKSLDISNINNYLGAINTLSGLVVPGTDDEGMQNILGSAGISAEAMPGYMAAIRQVHKDPGILAEYNKKQLAKKWTDAETAKYTDELIAGMTDLGYKVAYEQKQLDFHQSQLQRKISQLLNEDPNFAKDSADVVMDSLEVQGLGLDVQSDALNLKLSELKHDTQVFLETLQARADSMSAVDEVINHLKSIAGERSLTPEEIALMNKCKAEKISLRTMYSNQFYQLKDSWMRVSHTLYERYHRLNDKGELRPASQLEVANMFSDDTFNDMIYHTKTPGDIANMWFDSSVKAIGVAAEFTKAGMIYKGATAIKGGASFDFEYDKGGVPRLTRGTFKTNDVTNVPDLYAPEAGRKVGF